MSEENKTNEAAEEVKAEAVAEVEETTEATAAPETPAEEAQPQAASDSSDDFDWDAFDKKGFGEGYSAAERDELAKIYDDTLTTIEEKKVVQGTVVSISDRDVVLNIGFKSDGLVSSSEFRDTPDMKVGDQVEVYIEE